MAEFHPEKLTGGELDNKQFNDYAQTKALSEYFLPPDTVLTAHVLKDGADSVGVLGALNRVYHQHRPVQRGMAAAFPAVDRDRQEDLADRDRRAAEELDLLERERAQTPDMALFFLASARPDHLKDAPGGKAYLTTDPAKLNRGKIVFAENCARCHSSKQPPNLCLLGTAAGRTDHRELRRLFRVDARRGQEARLPRRQLPVDRAARPGHGARHQRVQPAGDQRHPRRHLGQFLVDDLQGAARGRQDHGLQSQDGDAVGVRDAGRRPRLHAAGVARSACGRRRRSC